jgi:hypothetical protein
LDISISFAGKDLSELNMYQGPEGRYYQAIVSLKVTWNDQSLSAEVSWNGEVLYPPMSSQESRSSQSTLNGLERPYAFHAESMESRITL